MSRNDDDLRTQAAQIMGMKPSEVVAAVDTPDGVVATTHDGKHTLIRDDGSMVFDVPAVAPVPAPAENASPEGEPPAKPKGRR